MSELRKNIYAATRELPVEVQAKGKILFYITEKPDVTTVPMVPTLTQEEQIKLTVKMVLEELGTRAINTPTPLNPTYMSTSPQKNEGATPLDVEVKPISIVRSIKNEPEALWEDYNLMPVYKTGVPDQYCVTWHSKGERRTVYPIKKFRADGSVELEGNYCKECIKEFLTKDGHLE